MDINTIIQTLSIVAIPLILAITVHEVMHGYVALKLGDSTAYRAGRLSLNPLTHIDPIGTVALPIALLLFKSPFIIGWAKPVPVNFSALRNPKRDMLWVALAGPMSNVIMAILWGYVAMIANGLDLGLASEFLVNVGAAGIAINIIFAALNLLPILPLDGGRIVASLLPSKLSYQYSKLEPYGMFILFGLLLFARDGLFKILTPFLFVIETIVNFFII